MAIREGGNRQDGKRNGNGRLTQTRGYDIGTSSGTSSSTGAPIPRILSIPLYSVRRASAFWEG